MPQVTDIYEPPSELALGLRLNERVPAADQIRQRLEVKEILKRLRRQPGMILADEVGMGKTFVALAIAYGIAVRSPRGPVIVMVPANLVEKWEQELRAFCDLYLDDRCPVRNDDTDQTNSPTKNALRYGVARHSIDLMKLLDDPPRRRCHLIFLAQGAMGRRQTDKWIRLALIAEALRRHGRGQAARLIQVKKQIHRFLAKLLWAIGEERAHDLGEDLWQRLLRTDPLRWKDTYNEAVRNERRHMTDDPVPKSVARALPKIDLKPLARALEQMPVRARGGEERVAERLDEARQVLREIEADLWKNLLAQARWRSPLLVMDEAHHLKNPGTLLARQLQSPDSEQDLKTGDGAMANAFDRMLFLTATPFQLGHHELVRVLERFGDVRWDTEALGPQDVFRQRLSDLRKHLDQSQRNAVRLQQCWSRLRPEDCDGEIDAWWQRLLTLPRDELTVHQRAVIDAYRAAESSRHSTQEALRPWIVRHNKDLLWAGTPILRRCRRDGAAVLGEAESNGGLPIPPRQMLPFFLAARSAVRPGQDLLGEALCSSYEAFRQTRKHREAVKDDQDELPDSLVELSHSRWYLREFDRALELSTGSTHPKIDATVRRAVDLWESGEKVLVFAFYRHTCRALRNHISREIERRTLAAGRRSLGIDDVDSANHEIESRLEKIQRRYFDDVDSPGRRTVDAALDQIIRACESATDGPTLSVEQHDLLRDVMRRFLRVQTTLVRCFPMAELDSIAPDAAVSQLLDHADASEVSWRRKFADFAGFLMARCSSDERKLYLEATGGTRTGDIRVSNQDDDSSSGRLANVREATGETARHTRARLMRAFNTPFFPDVLVCSQVMGEGVDLQRYCRHVIHHDLAWNPSTIEQRTGRIDRLGCKAEGRHPIHVDLPYLAGTADERTYRVMSDREQWFRVVMGQDEVAKLITPDSTGSVRLPDAVAAALSFELSLSKSTP